MGPNISGQQSAIMDWLRRYWLFQFGSDLAVMRGGQ